ncbi:hypothetical protein Adeg_0829 [Ammonifex degensii KC4]|uniref:Uncharacterized protein n=1 Tax=Ammonifex degensii (strain DSM 10501 / KC4) TaxID=429009 RepID=C9RCJ3_AMMDK|nr:hypothetical protein [Ammonifex degensii]ACX51970.1 hypothetical protein Adeg_0829 [Ammonifex degensii KC4]
MRVRVKGTPGRCRYAGSFDAARRLHVPYRVVPAREALFVDPRQAAVGEWAVVDCVCGYMESFPPVCEAGCFLASAAFRTRREAVLYAFRRRRERERRPVRWREDPHFHTVWPEGCVFYRGRYGEVVIAPCWAAVEVEMGRRGVFPREDEMVLAFLIGVRAGVFKFPLQDPRSDG